MSGVIATIATIPNASSNTLSLDCNTIHAPTANGKIKLDVSGPEATPPESKAMAVYSLGTNSANPKEIKYPGIM